MKRDGTIIYRRELGDGTERYLQTSSAATTDYRPVITPLRTCGNYCKRGCTFFLSHFGLCSFVVAYAIAGGFMFQILEAPNEQKQRHTQKDFLSDLQLRLSKRLWNITADMDNITKAEWIGIASGILGEFQESVHNKTHKMGWDSRFGEGELQWSYTGALLYSVTVITTIGYGHIAPKTDYGRLVTIFYALIGIPLTLLCLTKVGALLGNCFRFTYKYTCRFMAWVFLPKRSKYRQRRINSRRREAAAKHKSGSSGNRAARLPLTKDERVETDEEVGVVRVPIILCIAIVASYVFGGAVLFSLWEEDWSYLVGAYFCFTTLSTIGFGDFVPGSSLGSWQNQEKAVLCALYLIFGLAVIAMCFNLMQEEVKAKFHWLGQKLRLIDRETNTGNNRT